MIVCCIRYASNLHKEFICKVDVFEGGCVRWTRKTSPLRHFFRLQYKFWWGEYSVATNTFTHPQATFLERMSAASL